MKKAVLEVSIVECGIFNVSNYSPTPRGVERLRYVFAVDLTCPR
jgi:hypothetical protein